MENSILISGLFIGNCILFSTSLQIYMKKFDKDHNQPIIISSANVVVLCMLFHTLLTVSNNIYKKIG